MQGPKVSNMTRIRSGPSRVQIKVVNQGDELNQDSNHPWLSGLTILFLSSESSPNFSHGFLYKLKWPT